MMKTIKKMVMGVMMMMDKNGGANDGNNDIWRW